MTLQINKPLPKYNPKRYSNYIDLCDEDDYEVDDDDEVKSLFGEDEYDPATNFKVEFPASIIKVEDKKREKRTEQNKITRTKAFQDYLPEQTSGCCWWDTCPFTSHPVSCPVKYDAKRDRFQCEGVFCSYNCALAYGRHLSCRSATFIPQWIRYIRKQIEGGVSTTPKAARHFSLLDKFGGSMTIDEFRTEFATDMRYQCIPDRCKVKMIPSSFLHIDEETYNKLVLPDAMYAISTSVETVKKSDELINDWKKLNPASEAVATPAVTGAKRKNAAITHTSTSTYFNTKRKSVMTRKPDGTLGRRLIEPEKTQPTTAVQANQTLMSKLGVTKSYISGSSS